MLKLKHLFNNEELAKMILENWNNDPDSIDMFKYFRISANAVYPFKEYNEKRFLRFAHISEKFLKNVYAELDFLEYLKESGYNAVEAVSSKQCNKLEVVNTPWGEYIAAAFKGVPGMQISKAGFSDDIMTGFGESLGRLHRLSSEYVPGEYKRWSWEDALDWSFKVLYRFPDETLAIKEAEILRDYLSKLPVTNKTFGLIHYDFETDNVFYDAETKEYHVIDFDDTMYHWYVMDVVKTIESIKDDFDDENNEHAVECFINGYRSQFDVSDDMLALMTVFRRFQYLFAYARVLYTIEEKWNNEPDWMVNLRERLDMFKKVVSVNFGDSI